MEILTIESFISHIAPFANKELLTPAEASRLGLIITELLVDYRVDVSLMKFLSRFFTPDLYEDVIEERNIEHMCGYLLCSEKPKGKYGHFKFEGGNIVVDDPRAFNAYEINKYKKKVLWPRIYISSFCTREHYRSSLFYRNQLSDEAIFARKNIMVAPPFPEDYPANWYEKSLVCLEDVLSKHNELKEEGKTLSDIISMMSGLEVADTTKADTDTLVQLIQDLEIVEKEGGIESNDNDLDYGDDEANKDSIEGYTTSRRNFGGNVV